MNEKVNKFLLTGNKFLLGIHLRQLGITFSAFVPQTKNKDQIQIIKEFKETGGWRYIYQNELVKVCFQHVMAYEHFREKPTRW